MEVGRIGPHHQNVIWKVVYKSLRENAINPFQPEVASLVKAFPNKQIIVRIGKIVKEVMKISKFYSIWISISFRDFVLCRFLHLGRNTSYTLEWMGLLLNYLWSWNTKKDQILQEYQEMQKKTIRGDSVM